MTPTVDINIVSTLRRFSCWASYIVIAIAVMAMVGWILRVPVLASGIPGGAAMNPMSAIAFICAGLSLRLQIHEKSALHRRFGELAAWTVVFIGVVRLVDYFIGPVLRI